MLSKEQLKRRLHYWCPTCDWKEFAVTGRVCPNCKERYLVTFGDYIRNREEEPGKTPENMRAPVAKTDHEQIMF